MNGEALSLNDPKVNHMFPTGNGFLKESMNKEEAAAMGIIQRQPSKKIPGYNYTNENSLRFEQNKGRRLNYNPIRR
jgi:hypothetical protein